MITEAEFLKDVESHVMEVIRDDGVYRHIRFREPGTMCMHFDLVTWPGSLCYTGDMGTYVFYRLHDMFEFFRRPPHCRYSIDMRYWAEKVQAGDKSSTGNGIKEFDGEKFRRVLDEYRVRWMRDAKRDGDLDKEQRRELWEEVQDEVIDRIDELGEDVARVAYEFSWRPGLDGPRYHFDELWDHHFTEYTHRFAWCCFALSWAVQIYDKANEAAAPADHGA